MLLLLIEKCFNNAFKLSYKVFASSNANEIIRAVLNSLIFFFFTKRFCTQQKRKSTKTEPSKRTKRYKRTKMKNALKNI